MKRANCLLAAVCIFSTARSVPAHSSGAARPPKSLSGIVLTREMYQPPGPTGWPIHASVSRAILAIFTLWYRNANHWRVQGRYLAAPRDPFLVHNGALATPFFPFPGSVVQQGPVLRHYDAKHRLVVQVMGRSDGMNPMSGNASLYLDHYADDSLQSLLARERHCRSASLQGAQIMAGRHAYIVNLGPDRCNRASSADYLFVGREVAWIDTATLVLLRLDRFFPGTQRLVVQTVTDRVRFSGVG